MPLDRASEREGESNAASSTASYETVSCTASGRALCRAFYGQVRRPIPRQQTPRSGLGLCRPHAARGARSHRGRVGALSACSAGEPPPGASGTGATRTAVFKTAPTRPFLGVRNTLGIPARGDVARCPALGIRGPATNRAHPAYMVYAYSSTSWTPLADMTPGTACPRMRPPPGSPRQSKRRDWPLFGLFIATQLLPSLIMFSMSRFRLATMTFLLIGAGLFWVRGPSDWRASSRARRGIAVALSLLVLGLSALDASSVLESTGR